MPLLCQLKRVVSDFKLVYIAVTLQTITKFYIEWFRVYSNITSTFCTITAFKIFVKENNKSHVTCTYVHDLSLY
jgi:hypothetical protein